VKSMAGKAILWRGRLPPGMIRARRGARYLVITMKELRFAKRRFHAEHVPSPIARIDLLLLTLIRVRGLMDVVLAKRSSYGERTIEKAPSPSCVENHERPSGVPDRVRDKIVAVRIEAPREVYA
jgi:hypothetical protein